ncbi:MAG: GlsB/YeaQ/YmgE family stress response membrane protein [Rhodothermales bacterium]
MTILWFILIGFAAGALAKMITPSKEGGGFILTTLLGIAGAVVGGFLGGFFGLTPDSLLGELLFAVGGALVLLWAWNALKK